MYAFNHEHNMDDYLHPIFYVGVITCPWPNPNSVSKRDSGSTKSNGTFLAML